MTIPNRYRGVGNSAGLYEQPVELDGAPEKSQLENTVLILYRPVIGELAF